MDTRHALSMIDEDERIWILREMERLCLETLTVIEASYASDMRYTSSPYISDMPAPCIPQMLSSHAAHMPSLFDSQMLGSSFSYMSHMTALDPNWHHDSSFE